MADIGHNSKAVTVSTLRQYIERVERLDDERAVLGEDIKAVYAEAKGAGFDTKIMRRVISRRKRERAAVQEEDALLQTYEDALS